MADRRVQLQDEDGNNVFPVAFGTGEAAVQTSNLADSAVTTAKVADQAITTAKIADGSVTSDKIDWKTMNANQSSEHPWAKIIAIENMIPAVSPSWGPLHQTSAVVDITIDGVTHSKDNTNIMGFYMAGTDGVSSGSAIVRVEIGIVTFSNTASLRGKMVARYRHSTFGTNTEWYTV